MKFELYQLATLLVIFLIGCQPHNKDLSASDSTFRDIKTVYQIDSSGTQIAQQMYITFTCLLEGSTNSKRTELGYYQEPSSSKTRNSYFELREVNSDPNKDSNYSIKELLIADNLALSNLSVISLVVAKESKLLGSQVSVTTLPQLGGIFLEYSRQSGLGLFSAMSASGTPANMKCKSIRVP